MTGPVATAVVVVAAAGCVFFTFIGAVGLFRLPDVYCRAHAATKADTLGAGFALVAVTAYFGPGIEAVKTAILLGFIYVTNPTAAHAIARAAYSREVSVWTRSEPLDKDGPIDTGTSSSEPPDGSETGGESA